MRSGSKEILKIFSLPGLSLFLILSGCSVFLQPPQDADIVAESYSAGDRLLAIALQELNENKSLLVASFINIDRPGESSLFGQIVADQISSRITQKGYRVLEHKIPIGGFTQGSAGNSVQSPDVRKLAQFHDVQAIVVGTYAMAASKVYVNARIIRVTDDIVLASYDYSLFVGENFKTMLTTKSPSAKDSNKPKGDPRLPWD